MDLALKYRPRSLSEVIGQECIVRTLSNAFTQKKLHTAYLFCGQFGCGKTSAGRILAAMENCLISPGLHPCGKCRLCTAIFDGSHVDIEELDAAGNMGKVEQTRKLKEAAMYSPVDGAMNKYFICDEVHRMSDSAIDSLLKVLEEPPDNVRFVLCTTDAQKLRPAVISRCQRHDFRPIYWTVIASQLEKIGKQEKLDCEPAALNLCARLAKGSMRNGIRNLEKLISYAGSTKLSAADAQSMFGAISELLFYDLMEQVVGMNDAKPDASAGFRVINKMLAGGAEFITLYEGVSEMLRNLLVGLTSSSAYELLNLSDEGRTRLTPLLKKIHSQKKTPAILTMIHKLQDAKSAVDLNISPEMALQTWFVQSIFDYRV